MVIVCLNIQQVHALVLSNGLLAMCYNAHTTKSVKDGVRTFLNVAVSPDRGKTWEVRMKNVCAWWSVSNLCDEQHHKFSARKLIET